MPKVIPGEALDFDDVLIVPRRSQIKSRNDVDLTTVISRNPNTGSELSIGLPIIAANMNTITGYRMVKAMNSLGGTAFLHRYQSPESVVKLINRLESEGSFPIIPSVG